ncbi:MAG: Hint domain-containing protein [Thermoplasmata archaeon]
MQLSNVNVQGVMPVPPTMGNGLDTVFLGTTDQYGICTITNFSLIDMVYHAWRSYQGSFFANHSYPDIVIYLTYVIKNNTYFAETSIHTNPAQIVADKSFSVSYSINLNSKAQYTNTTLITSAPPLTSLPPTQPINAYECWIQIQNNTYPSSGYGQIPVAWITANGGAYGLISMAIFNTASTNYNIGIATGVDGGTVGYDTGATLWTTTEQFGETYTIPINYSGNGYIYVNGQVEGALYQLFYVTAHGTIPTNDYQYEAGIINIQVNSNGDINGGINSGNPPQINQIDQNYTLTYYNSITGNGNLSPNYQVNSTQFVDTYAAYDITWIDIGVDVGAILVWALGPEVAIPADIALSIAGSVSSSSTSFSMSWVQYDALNGYDADLYVFVGNEQYTMSNNYEGYIPLMGIDILGYNSGGGGCVLNNTYITLANREQVPVQDLKVGDELLSYNYNIGQYVTAEVSNISASNVTNIIDINNGSLYMSGLGDQPMLVKMQDGVIETTTLGQLNYGMQVYVPLLLKWIPITSIKLLTGSFTVYDIKTIGNVDYIANGVLIIPK